MNVNSGLHSKLTFSFRKKYLLHISCHIASELSILVIQRCTNHAWRNRYQKHRKSSYCCFLNHIMSPKSDNRKTTTWIKYIGNWSSSLTLLLNIYQLTLLRRTLITRNTLNLIKCFHSGPAERREGDQSAQLTLQNSNILRTSASHDTKRQQSYDKTRLVWLFWKECLTLSKLVYKNNWRAVSKAQLFWFKCRTASRKLRISPDFLRPSF